MHYRKSSNVKGHYRSGTWIASHSRSATTVSDYERDTKYVPSFVPNNYVVKSLKKEYDKYGFDDFNYHKITNSIYDEKGFTVYGYDKFGFGRNGKHKRTKTRENKDGFTKKDMNETCTRSERIIYDKNN